jgi:hypothetical protein
MTLYDIILHVKTLKSNLDYTGLFYYFQRKINQLSRIGFIFEENGILVFFITTVAKTDCRY